MVRYIDDHKDRYGVEPICRMLPIAPSTYYEEKARERDPDRRPVRYHRDEALKPEITRVWQENFRVYGARKVWKPIIGTSTIATRLNSDVCGDCAALLRSFLSNPDRFRQAGIPMPVF